MDFNGLSQSLYLSHGLQKDWDVRMACLLLLALDTPDNFWQLYGDYLPSVDDSSSLLLASEVKDFVDISFVVAVLLHYSSGIIQVDKIDHLSV